MIGKRTKNIIIRYWQKMGVFVPVTAALVVGVVGVVGVVAVAVSDAAVSELLGAITFNATKIDSHNKYPGHVVITKPLMN